MKRCGFYSDIIKALAEMLFPLEIFLFVSYPSFQGYH